MKRILLTLYSFVLPTDIWALSSEYRGFRSYHLQCESDQEKLNYCPLRSPTVGVLKYNRTSSASCTFGKSLGYSARYLWLTLPIDKSRGFLRD